MLTTQVEDWNLFLKNKEKGYMPLTTMEEVQVSQTREEVQVTQTREKELIFPVMVTSHVQLSWSCKFL